MALIKLNTRSLSDDSVTTDKIADASRLDSDRNILINGAMEVSQRGTSFSAAAWSNEKTIDKWVSYAQGGGTYSIDQSTDVPTGTDSVTFDKSLKCTVSTTDTSLAANDHYILIQRVEGTHFKKATGGVTGTREMTASFWFKTSVNQTYSFCARAIGSGTYSYATDFTPTALNTWERVSFTIPAQTSMVTETGIGEAFSFLISLSNGSTFHTPSTNTWVSGNYHSTANNGTSWIGTSGATFYLTGCQLELGSTATPFAYRSFDDELERCKRYFQKSWDYNTAIGSAGFGSCVGRTGLQGINTTSEKYYSHSFEKEMRTTPSIQFYDTAGNAGKCTTTAYMTGDYTNRSVGAGWSSPKGFGANTTDSTSAGGLTVHFWANADL